MTQTELATALETLGLPVAYRGFKKPTKPPFITYLFAYSGDLMADNTNALELSNFQIELYTEIKDLVSEALVQDKLKELFLPYRKVEAWLEDEKLIQVIYEIQLTGG